MVNYTERSSKLFQGHNRVCLNVGLQNNPSQKNKVDLRRPTRALLLCSTFPPSCQQQSVEFLCSGPSSRPCHVWSRPPATSILRGHGIDTGALKRIMSCVVSCVFAFFFSAPSHARVQLAALKVEQLLTDGGLILLSYAVSTNRSKKKKRAACNSVRRTLNSCSDTMCA